MILFLLKRFLFRGHVEFRGGLRPLSGSCKHFTIKGKQGSLLSVVLAPHLVVVGFWWLNHGKWGRPLHRKPREKWTCLVGSCGKFLGVSYSLSSYFYLNMGNNFLPSWELTCQHFFKMIILFPRWDILYYFFENTLRIQLKTTRILIATQLSFF